MNNYAITLDDSKILLSQELIELLGIKVGDRISIEYSEFNNEIVPIIIKSDGGNKLTKSNTISLRGRANVELAKYGTNFNAHCENGIVYLLGDDPEYKIYTNINAAIEHIDRSIIEDDNFNIKLDSFIL